MCFSANASFASSILLSVIGVTSVAKTTSKSQMMFAGIPIFFAVQQCTEGFIWLSFKNNDEAFRNGLLYLYLSFAYVLWPVFIPISILLIEKNVVRKKILKFISLIGIALSLSYLVCLMTFSVSVTSGNYHISYLLKFPDWFLSISSIVYGVVTLLPQFISGIKGMKWMGLLVSLSYLFSLIFYTEYIISIWCFFAALISVVIYFILQQQNHLVE